jgi:hypothetical protein
MFVHLYVDIIIFECCKNALQTVIYVWLKFFVLQRLISLYKGRGLADVARPELLPPEPGVDLINTFRA